MSTVKWRSFGISTVSSGLGYLRCLRTTSRFSEETARESKPGPFYRQNMRRVVCSIIAVLVLTATAACGWLFESKDRSEFARRIDAAIEKGAVQEADKLELTDVEITYLLGAARRVLEESLDGRPEKITPDDFKDVPEKLSNARFKAFVTILVNGRTRGRKARGRGTLLENVIASTYRAISDRRFGGPLRREEVPRSRIHITMLGGPVRVEGQSARRIGAKFELGIDSISIREGDKHALFLSSVPVSHSYGLKKLLRKLGRKAKLGSGAYEKPGVHLRKYGTLVISEGEERGEALTLYRYNILRKQSGVTKRSHEAALRLCLDYMLSHTSSEGLITYQYDPYNDRKVSSDSTAATVRRLASTWALAAFGNYFEERRAIDAARRSISGFLKKHYTFDEGEGFGYLKVKDGANIAVPAFVILALLEIGDPDFHAAERANLVEFIMAMEDRDQGFLYPVYLPSKDHKFASKEIYYPGEALTALMALFERTGDAKYRQVAERVFEYYRDLFRSSKKRASLAPWMSKAYAKLFHATGERRYADFVFEMSDYLLERQKGVDAKYVDLIGAVHTDNSCIASPTFVEGIVEGLGVAKALGDAKRIEAYRKAVLMGSRFTMQCQFTDENMFAIRDRKLTLGGIRERITGSTIRIDGLQHSGFALINAIRYLYD